jgi:hypothetical protein
VAQKESSGKSEARISREQLVSALNEDLAREYQAIISLQEGK